VIVLFGLGLNGSFKIPALDFLEAAVKLNSFSVIALNLLTLLKVLLLVKLQHFDSFSERVNCVVHPFNEILEMPTTFIILFLSQHESTEFFQLSFKVHRILLLLEIGEMLLCLHYRVG
jgi:hypothetical protein